MEPLKIINRIELAQALGRAQIIMMGTPLAEKYRLVTRRWFIDEFGPALMKVLAKFGISRNTAQDGWDCSDLALFGAGYARVLNVLSEGAKESVAIGVMGYGGLMTPGHAIMLAVTDEGVAFYDPTYQKEVSPTLEERQLCRVTIF